MIRITSYECEFCGATFEDEEECEVHELLEHDIKRYINEIHCWDWHGKPVNIFDIVKNCQSSSDTIGYIKCDSIEAIHAVIQIFDILGEYSPYDDDNCPEGQEFGLWYYQTDFLDDNPIEKIESNGWVNLTYLRNEITSRMEAIGIEERKI